MNLERYSMLAMERFSLLTSSLNFLRPIFGETLISNCEEGLNLKLEDVEGYT
jgi:hypothetical protein